MTATPFTVDRAAFETRMATHTPPDHFLVTEAKTARPVSITLNDHIRCSFIGLVKRISIDGTMKELREAVGALAQAENIAERRQREL